MAMESENLYTGKKAPLLWRPDTMEEAWQCKKRYGASSRYVAGGTWLRTRWEAGLASRPEHVISLEHIPTLRSLHLQRDGSIMLGAGVRLSELVRSEQVQDYFPLIRLAGMQIAACSIRNQATVGGNIMSGSGDLLPALLASEALLIVYDGRRLDRIPVAEWVGLASKPNELLLAGVRVCSMQPGHRPFFHKIGRREQFTPSVIAAAGWYSLSRYGKIADIRLAVGGASMRAVRLRKAEAAARGGRPGAVAAAVHRAAEEETPEFGDDYASAGYRKLSAANLIAAELLGEAGKGGDGDALESGDPQG